MKTSLLRNENKSKESFGMQNRKQKEPNPERAPLQAMANKRSKMGKIKAPSRIGKTERRWTFVGEKYGSPLNIYLAFPPSVFPPPACLPFLIDPFTFPKHAF